MSWDDKYKSRVTNSGSTSGSNVFKQSASSVGAWDAYVSKANGMGQQFNTISLYDPSVAAKKYYTAADFAPLQTKWAYKWNDQYDENDMYDKERRERNLPPASIIATYDFTDAKDKKRFKDGLPSLQYETKLKGLQADKDSNAYQQERARTSAAGLPAPVMPDSIAALKYYKDQKDEYNLSLKNMDPIKLAYLKAVNKLPTEPKSPGYALTKEFPWADLALDDDRVVVKDVKLYQAQKQANFDTAMKQRNLSWWDRTFNNAPKDVVTPKMPDSLLRLEANQAEWTDYNNNVKTMDPGERLNREAAGTMPKAPNKLGYDLPVGLSWDDLNKDLWNNGKPLTANTPVSTPTGTPTPTATRVPSAHDVPITYPGMKSTVPNGTNSGGGVIEDPNAKSKFNPSTLLFNKKGLDVLYNAGTSLLPKPEGDSSIPMTRADKSVLGKNIEIANSTLDKNISEINIKGKGLTDIQAQINTAKLKGDNDKANALITKYTTMQKEIAPQIQQYEKDVAFQKALSDNYKNAKITDPAGWGEVVGKGLMEGIHGFNIQTINAARIGYKVLNAPSDAIVRGVYGDKEADKQAAQMPVANWLTDVLRSQEAQSKVYSDSLKDTTGLKKIAEQTFANVPQLIAAAITGAGLESLAAGTVIAGVVPGAADATGIIQAANKAQTVATAVKAANFQKAIRMIPFGAGAGASYARDAELDGKPFAQQVLYGVVGGLLEVATESPVLEGFLSLPGAVVEAKLKSGAMTFAKRYGAVGVQWLSNGMKEFAQEAVMEPLSALAKKATLDSTIPYVGDKGVLSVQRLKDSVQSGFGGIGMYVVMSSLGLPGMTLSKLKVDKAVRENQKLDKTFMDDFIPEYVEEMKKNPEQTNIPVKNTAMLDETIKKIAAPGTKTTLKGLGEVEVVSEIDDKHISIKKVDGKVITVLKTAFAAGMQTPSIAMPSPMSTSPVEQPMPTGIQTPGQGTEVAPNIENMTYDEKTTEMNRLDLLVQDKKDQSKAIADAHSLTPAGTAYTPQEISQVNNYIKDIKTMEAQKQAIVDMIPMENGQPVATPETAPAIPQEVSTPSVEKAVETLRPYVDKVTASGTIKKVSVVGSVATKGNGNDTDLLYDLGDITLPKDGFEAADKIEQVIESLDHIDIDAHDSFFKAGDRYFHVQNGAGRTVIENTNYAKEQEGKPIIQISSVKPQVTPAIETTQSSNIVAEVKPTTSGIALPKTDNKSINDVQTPAQSIEPSVQEYRHDGFKVGQYVGYTNKNGKELTGHIRALDDYNFMGKNYGKVATIDVDQIMHAGGVPIGRIETGIQLSRLKRLSEDAQVDTKETVAQAPTQTENAPIIEKPKGTLDFFSAMPVFETLTPREQEMLLELESFNNRNSKVLDAIDKDIVLYKTEYNSIVEEHIAYLKSSGGQGVNQGSLIRDEHNSVTGRVPRTSNNPQWYRDYFAKHGKAPISAESYRMLAIDQLREGFEDFMQVSPNAEFIGLENLINGTENFRQKLAASLETSDFAGNITQNEDHAATVTEAKTGNALKIGIVPIENAYTTKQPTKTPATESDKTNKDSDISVAKTYAESMELYNKIMAVTKDSVMADKLIDISDKFMDRWQEDLIKGRAAKRAIYAIVKDESLTERVFDILKGIPAETIEKNVSNIQKGGIIESKGIDTEGGKPNDSGTLAEPQEGTRGGGRTGLPDDGGNTTVRGNATGQSERVPSGIPAETQEHARVPKVGAATDNNGVGDTGENVAVPNDESDGGKRGRSPDEHDDSGQRFQEGSGQNIDRGSTENISGPGRSELPDQLTSENYVIKDNDSVFTKGGKKTRFKANLMAMETLAKILESKRQATTEEQAILAQFSGWGAIQEAFDYTGWGATKRATHFDWTTEFKQTEEIFKKLSDLMESTGHEGLYEEAKKSTINAFYTSPDIIKGIYESLKIMGFKGGNILEPSMGIGNFFGMMPQSMAYKSSLHGVELDPITGHIAKLLYPNADVRIKGYQDVKYPDNFFDVAIGNVPFAENDMSNKDVTYKGKLNLHNYFFARTIDKVRPGGIIAFITSTGTLDSHNNSFRTYMSNKANLIGSIRLPNTAFKDNAGTEVTSDIIFLQKLKEGERSNNNNWRDVGEVTVGDRQFNLNQYYIDNPHMMLGELEQGTMYGGNSMILKATSTDVTGDLLQTIQKNITSDLFKQDQREPSSLPETANPTVDDNVRDGTFIKKGTKIFVKKDGKLNQVVKDQAQIGNLIDMKDMLKNLLAMQRDVKATDSSLFDLRKALKKSYDSYVKKYGTLRKRKKERTLQGNTIIETLLKGDAESYLFRTLEMEVLNDNGDQVITSSDILTQRTFVPYTPITRANNVDDGLTASLNDLGTADIDHISKIIGKTKEQVISGLGDKIYNNPAGEWETAGEYLSGNVRKKLALAKENVEFDAQYQRNIDALEKVIPKDLDIVQIPLSTGEAWIPAKYTAAAINDLLGFGQNSYTKSIEINYSPINAEWSVTQGKNFRNTPEMNAIETSRRSALAVVKTALNDSDTRITYKDEDGHIIFEKDATIAFRTKVDMVKAYMNDWILNNPEAAMDIQHIYNDTFNNLVERKHDGSKLTLPNKNPDINLKPHQLNVVSRAVAEGNVLMGHAVGSGKTYAQIAIVMEYRRLRLANKPLMIVPNNKLVDYENDFKDMYPGAKLLVLDSAAFTQKDIKNTLTLAATNDWDCVIIRHSSFSKIPMGADIERNFIEKQIIDLEMELATSDDGNKFNTKALQKKIQALRDKLEKAIDVVKYDMLTFDEIGFDMLVVDEAHGYKNLFVPGKKGQTKGMAVTAAAKTYDLLMKSDYIRKLHNNKRGLIYATGTPVTNTVAEIFILMKYLRPDLLEERGISHFDAWAKTFANIGQNVEIGPSGVIKAVERFKGFKNLPELHAMYSVFTDTKLAADLDLDTPKLSGGKPEIIKCPPHPLLKEIMDGVTNGWDQAIKDKKTFILFNQMKIAPIDARLVRADAKDFPGSKVNKAVAQVKKDWLATKKQKGTQIVFIARGRSSITGFDLFEDMITKLVKSGIPRAEIALATGTITTDKLTEMYDKVNKGEIRVLLGTQGRLGTGVNVQKRLYAIHEVDVPYKPADIEQGEGRMIRQKNMYFELDVPVHIYRYVTQGESDSFSGDAFMWQLIENKLRIFNQFLRGDKTIREMAADDEADDAGMMKAIATGNPLFIELVQANAELDKVRIAKKSFQSAKLNSNVGLKRSSRQQEATSGWIRGYKREVSPLLDKISRNDPKILNIDIGKKRYNDINEADIALVEIIEKLQLKTNVKETEIASYEGFTLYAETVNTVDGPAALIFFIKAKGYSEQHYAGMAKGDAAVEYTQSFTNEGKPVARFLKYIKKLPDMLEEISELYEVRKADTMKYQILVNKEFPDEAKFQALQARIEEINKELGMGEVNIHQDDPDSPDDDTTDDNDDEPSSNRKIIPPEELTKESVVQSRPKTATSGTLENMTSSGNEITKPVSRSEIEQFVSDKLDIPVAQGKFRQHSLGIFKPNGVIRLKHTKDLETLFHEVGHALDKWLNLYDTQFEGELMSLGAAASKESYTDKQIMQEGIAEFVLNYTVDNAKAKQLAPKYYDFFKTKIDKESNIKSLLSAAGEATRNYTDQNPIQRILGNVSLKGEKITLAERFNMHKLYTTVFDELHPIYQAIQRITGGEKIEAALNPFMRAWAFRGIAGKADAILKFGPIDNDNQKMGRGFQDIIQPVEHDLDNFRAYILAKHGKELEDKGKKTGFRKNDIDYALANLDAAKYEPILKELVQFQNNVLKQLVYSGILSEESYKNITEAYSFYIPFQRVMDSAKGGGTGKGFQAKNPIYGIKGSMRDIIDPLESIIKNTFIITNMADRNRVGGALVELADNYDWTGKILDKVPPRMMGQRFAIGEIDKILRDAGVDTEGLNMDAIATIFRPTGYSSKDNVITVFKDGKPTYYEVFDKELYHAFTAMDKETTNIVIKILSIPTKILRAGATGLNMDFMGRNIIKDTIFAGLSSKYNFIPFVDSLKGLAHVLNQDDMYQKWLYSGGANSEMISVDRDNLKKTLKDLLTMSAKDKTMRIITNPIELIRAWSAFAEDATRVGVFAKGFKKESDKEGNINTSGLMEAGVASRETTVDFGRFGTVTRNINKTIAFFNAALQGSDTIVRSYRRNPGKFLRSALLYLTIPAIVFFLLNHDDPEYQEMPQYKKDLFWMFKAGGVWYSIPKPYELGMMFATLPERFLNYVLDNDPKAFDGWAVQFRDVLLPNVIFTAMLPALESMFNFDTFRGIPIVPMSERYSKPANQFGPYTSTFAKSVGKLLNISPRQVDHLIGGYAAGVGTSLAQIAGAGLEATGLAPKAVSPDASWQTKVPILKGITAEPYRNSKSVNDFYNALNAMETEYQWAKDEKNIELGQFPKASELRKLRKTSDKLAETRRAYNDTYSNNKISSDVKRQQLSKLNMLMINFSRQALGKPMIKE